MAMRRYGGVPTIELATEIHAPIERVFNLARSIELHTASTFGTRERAVGGITSGLIGPGQEVTWQARHFGVWHSLTVCITEFEQPTHFADVLVRGPFRRMEHHHYFQACSGGTTMRDVFTFESPFGMLGRLTDWLLLEGYMRRFLSQRNRVLKETAESEAWTQYVPVPDVGS